MPSPSASRRENEALTLLPPPALIGDHADGSLALTHAHGDVRAAPARRRRSSSGSGRPAARAPARAPSAASARAPAGAGPRRRRARRAARRHRPHRTCRGRRSPARGPGDPLQLRLPRGRRRPRAAGGRRVQLTLAGPGARGGPPANRRAGPCRAPAMRGVRRARWPRRLRGRVPATPSDDRLEARLQPAPAATRRSTGGCSCAGPLPSAPPTRTPRSSSASSRRCGQPGAATAPLRLPAPADLLRPPTGAAARPLPAAGRRRLRAPPVHAAWAPDYPGPGPRRRHDRLAAPPDARARPSRRAARAGHAARASRLPLYLTEWGYRRTRRGARAARSAYVRRGLALAARIPSRAAGRLVPARRPAEGHRSHLGPRAARPRRSPRPCSAPSAAGREGAPTPAAARGGSFRSRPAAPRRRARSAPARPTSTRT